MLIRDISKGEEYTFRVAGFNAVGMSHPSGPSETIDTSNLNAHGGIFTTMWITVEIMLVVIVAIVILVVWRRRKQEKDVESRVKYMELSPIMDDDLESAGGRGGYPSQALNAEPPLESNYGNHTMVSIEAVLSDTSERMHFRDYCEQEGVVGYFKFFQAVEDLHR